MKVFSLLSLYGNLENFKEARVNGPFITLFGEHCFPATSPYGCGVLFICFKVFQNLRTDKRECLTLSCIQPSILEADWR